MIDLDAIQPGTMEFQLRGVTYSVPTLDALEADPVLELVNREGVRESDVLALFRGVLEKHAPEALAGMTLAQLKALVSGWQTTGDVGESSPSSD